MITHAKPVTEITVTIKDTSTVVTYILENTEIPDGVPTTEQLLAALNAIAASQIILSSGPISYEDTWEIAISMKQSGELGLVGSSPSKKEKKSPSTTVKKRSASKKKEKPALVE